MIRLKKKEYQKNKKALKEQRKIKDYQKELIERRKIKRKSLKNQKKKSRN